MKLAAAVLAVILTLSSVGAQTLVSPVKQIGAPTGFAGKVFDATFAVYHRNPKGEDIFICTATAFEKIAGGYNLLSAGHCVDGTPAEDIFTVSDDLGNPAVPVRVVRARRDATGQDFAIFELKTAGKYPVIPLGDERDSRIGDATLNTNFALELGKQLTRGIVASAGLYKHPRYFIVDEYGNAGASGSAVVSEKTHRIIGVTIAMTGDAGVGMFIERISTFPEFLAAPDMQTQLHVADKDDEDN
jgi:hypothetical protein